ncbi:MAG TPA: TetR/AcrR family transcriptional regulator [Alicycliphilus sp.]|nr:TetR/AcrR family transcriptional regulator [Alicycliphilus sp.]
MSGQAGQPARARAPRQSRGQARVETILDAAAAIVASEGVGAVTMHALAKRAGTSIGSLYHFFPDRDSVLAGLRERHFRAHRAIAQALLDTPAATWAALSSSEAVRRMSTPYIAYLREHAEYLPLMHGLDWADDENGFLRLIRHMLDARLPGVDPALRADHAAMLHAIAAGAMYVGYALNPRHLDMYLREIPHALNAYLADVETRQRPGGAHKAEQQEKEITQ